MNKIIDKIIDVIIMIVIWIALLLIFFFTAVALKNTAWFFIPWVLFVMTLISPLVEFKRAWVMMIGRWLRGEK